ncbi:MAG: hypothetical protein IT443_01300 [Phycisphaeraceae bacterium]|nr:hypothetical protein [Phycisphaeraceae bacterium]
MVVGWAVDNPTVTIIWRALVCMGVCYAVGRVFGGVAAHAVQIEIDAHKKKYPLPPRGGEAVTMPSVDAASHAPAKDDGTLEAA